MRFGRLGFRLRARGTALAVSLLALTATLFWSTAPAAAADGQLIRDWNDLAFAAVRANNASDAQAARLYAMVDAAMYDAVNGTAAVGMPRQAAIVAPASPVPGDPGAAAAQAAHDLLNTLYPRSDSAYDDQLSADVAAAPDPTAASQGQEWGKTVASQVLAARSNDGSSPNQDQLGGSGPGVFPLKWSGTQFRNLAPFVIADPDAYVSSGPPALDSRAYTDAFNEVKQIGSAAIPDQAKSDTFAYWSLGGRTNQPPGGWLQAAEAVSAARSLSLPDAARLFALESMAMADTVGPTYKTKYVFHSWRPTTAIQQADTDGNRHTVADPSWAPRAGSPGSSPEHWSGHSSFSAAGSDVLAGFFCTDRIPFALVTDTAPGGQARTYDKFSTAAAEAGRSRVFGGLHFQFSNQAGLAAGRAIASEVLSKALLLRSGPTHHGKCPL
jgi:hypothetical protein